MEIPKLKSHSPKIYDNTEGDIILVSPSVLDNKLRDLEIRSWATGSIGSYVGLAVTLLAAIFASEFKNFSYISGQTIRGVFIAGFVVVIIKIGYDIYKILWSKNSRDRKTILSELQNLEKPDKK